MQKPFDPDADDDLSETRSRSDNRRAGRVREAALEKLANDLVELGPARLARLELPEQISDAVRDARAMSSLPAKNRQVRLVRNLLRDADWGVIRVKVDTLRVHGVVPENAQVGEEGTWVVRLVGEGDAALSELLRLHPKTDRGHVRALVRNVQRATAGRKEKAELALADAIRRVLRG